jgi:hypothetical protein
MISDHGAFPSLEAMRTRAPTAGRPETNRVAKASLTTTTRAPSGRSRSSNARPARTGMPSVRKKSRDAIVVFAVGSVVPPDGAPSTSIWEENGPCGGNCDAIAAPVTPGVDCTPSSNRSKNAVIASPEP